MTDLFAVDDPQADRSYVSIHDPKHEGAARARTNCEDLWRDFEAHASKHFLAEFPYRFHQRWFEMYLAVSLIRAGFDVHCPKESAPDVRVQYRDGRIVWIEAISPTGGDDPNPDRVVQPRPAPGESSVGFYVPREQVTLRVSGALHAKAQKLREYRDNGVIAPEHQAIVAINVHDIPHGFYDAETYGLAATYGVGPQVMTFDRATLAFTGSHVEYRPELRRTSGNPVDTAPFFNPSFEHVTGALISATDAANCPKELGVDFMLLPNPGAAPRYIEGQLPLGREWKLQRAEGGYNIEVIEHQKWSNSTDGASRL